MFGPQPMQRPVGEPDAAPSDEGEMKHRLEFDDIERQTRPIACNQLGKARAHMHVVFEHGRVSRGAGEQPPPGLAMAEDERRFGLGKCGPRRAAGAAVDGGDKLGDHARAGAILRHERAPLGGAREVQYVDRRRAHRQGTTTRCIESQNRHFQRAC